MHPTKRQAKRLSRISYLQFEPLEQRSVPTVLIYNPPSTGQSVTQTSTIKLPGLDYKPVTYQLTVSNPGAVKLSQTTVTAPTRGWATVTITPTRVSTSYNDVKISVAAREVKVDPVYFTIVSATIPQHIRSQNTPSGMLDRIPPRVDTNFSVNVTPDLKGTGEYVSLSVLGQSNKNGTATINGNSTLRITSSQQIALRGSSQTMASASYDTAGNVIGRPGAYAGQLSLALSTSYGSTVLRSYGFSVAAIPVNFDTYYDRSILIGEGRGINLAVTWDSDSGNISDLNSTYLLEKVHIVSASGSFKGLTDSQIAFQTNPSVMSGSANDVHSAPLKYLRTRNSKITINQVHVMTNLALSPTASYAPNFVAIPSSGYQISFEVTQSQSSYNLIIAKRGANVKVGPFTSNAGRAVISKTIPV